MFALALAGLALLSLCWGDFVYLWQPVPAWVSGRPFFAYVSGALLLAVSVGLLWRRSLARASRALSFYGLASMLLVHVPRIVMEPGNEGEWFGLGEIATFVAGASILFAGTRAGGGERGVRLARVVFALALPTFGLSHFVYAQTTAGMVPAWLPGHLAWAYVTGAAHIAAGLAILVGVLPRLAATLEAIMVSIFLLAVNIPELVRNPGGHWQWTEVFVASAIGGAALLVARSYRGDRAAN